MKYIIICILLWNCVTCMFAQSGNHKWVPLEVTDTKKVWVDESNRNSIDDNIADIWLLQMYLPPLQLDGIKGEVYRSKTLYTVDLTNVKYGIEKIYYYDSDNKEIYSFDYNLKVYEDSLKYTYPVLQNSSLHKAIKELFIHKEK